MSAASLLDLKSLSAETIARIFSLADRLSGEKPADRDHFPNRRGLSAALVFFEPSTRTRLSFETACLREGLRPVILDGAAGSSLEKGESAEDTLLNIAAMNPSVMVVRSGDALDMEAMSRALPGLPWLNAGWGRRGHPTQALLDLFALVRKGLDPASQRLLLIGDVRHSRVAASHFELARVLGYEVALCGPASFLPERPTARVFESLRDGLRWATAAMALRVQLERHPGATDLKDYHGRWGLNADSLKALAPKAVIMHPGPVNWGVEMSSDVMRDPRSVILEQVGGGVWIRQALVRRALEGKV
ncbi:MAG: aspartate carbamoyltransferase catalytic subunit [Bdellovibrionaceae bacterium]|nr:aspartate carbamoyltransferase catalytic subunit [Pseudobdellovibrionaceae bacterium]MBX3035014.1 aspartate carbamoyltransferase catalytic subunit [Pseudobdellovibrionaceae bacterium]